MQYGTSSFTKTGQQVHIFQGHRRDQHEEIMKPKISSLAMFSKFHFRFLYVVITIKGSIIFS